MGIIDILDKRKKEIKYSGIIENASKKAHKRKIKFIKEETEKLIKKQEGKSKQNKYYISTDGKLSLERPNGITKIKGVSNKNIILSDRVHTGIPGLDDVMQGGFLRNSVNLIGGGAGCGKSIFSMQYLVNGIDKHKENGVYISFEENKNKIIRNFRKFNWKLQEKINNKKLSILYFTPEQVNRVITSGGGIVKDVIKELNAKRVVIDSLTAFNLLFNSDLEKRRGVLDLFETLEKWGVTSLVTSEQEPDPDKHISTIMEFEVDGVILLYNLKRGDVRERSLEIFKMRATKHAVKMFPLIINDAGITIYPEQEVF